VRFAYSILLWTQSRDRWHGLLSGNRRASLLTEVTPCPPVWRRERIWARCDLPRHQRATCHPSDPGDRSRRSVGNAHQVTVHATSGAAWDQARTERELGEGNAGHDRGADTGQVRGQVLAVHPAVHSDRQHSNGKPSASLGLHAEILRAPQDGSPDGAFRQVMPRHRGTSILVQKASHTL
jgi:hypothetical protein